MGKLTLFIVDQDILSVFIENDAFSTSQILNDMDSLSHTMGKSNWYSREKYGTAMLDAVSLDGMLGMDDDGDFKQDRLKSLGVDDKDITVDRDEIKQMKQIQELIEKKFKQRDVDIFYRY